MIGLREGIEASLIVGILIAYLKKTDQKHNYSKVWLGVIGALVTAIFVGLALSALDAGASERTEIAITGATSLLTVVFVTWMVFWMRKTARNLSSSLQSQLASASGFSLFAVAYLSIVREGVETSIFLWSEAKTTGGGVSAWLGATLGLLAAATLGWLIYRGMLRFNLGKFFTYTGAYLLVLTAGIFAYALGEFTELGFLPETSSAYDFTAVTPEGSPIEIALKGTLGYLPNPSWIQCAAWVGFVAISLALYLRKPAKKN